MRKKLRKFPKEVYVTQDINCDGDNNLLAWTGVGDGIEDDGPTDVAVYELKEVVVAKKTLEFE